MDLQYGRVCYVIIGRPEGETLRLNVRCTFDILKTVNTFSNKAKITLYNLSPETRRKLNDEKLPIQVIAGFEGQEAIIFIGEIQLYNRGMNAPDYLSTSYQQGDYLTSLECTDAQFAYDLVVSFEAKKDESKEKVFRDVLRKMNVSLGPIKPPPGRFERSFSFDGYATDFINDVLLPSNITWNISDGVFSSLDESYESRDVIVLSRETGLYNKLQKQTEIRGVNKKTAFITGGCLLNPRLNPNSLIEVHTSQTSDDGTVQNIGRFIIIEVNHKGDNYSGEFSTYFKARSYDV